MTLSDRQYFALRKLHSLTGVVPVGAFLVEHFFTNARALQGAEAFDGAARDLARLPFVVLLEAGGIWLPLLFHMVVGLLIATTAQANLLRHGYARNWQYALQRASGVLLAFYVLFHTWETRFNGVYLHSASPYEYMHQELASPGMIAFYALGVLSASYHFGNGLFGFAIHWGLASGRQAQRWAARLGMAVFAVFAIVGLAALLAFATGLRLDFLQKPHAFEHTSVVTRVGGGR